MEKSHSRKYEILERNSNGIEFKVFFQSLDEVLDAFRDLSTMREAYNLQGIIQNLQNLCESGDGEIFIPTDNSLPKARWVMLSAAASYPKGVPIRIPLEKLSIDNSTLSAYCTSKNNPTSRYLYIRDEKVFTKPDGISWVDGLLKS